ncbi:unnamed protein product [Tilletia controversa]|uniref:Mid2 domain-containing protein n=3 Tax=Tilletia TaxID=13289 RepID=A0A8X7MZ06_9BASI|nr:hypothetical protein CF336_g1715 [Tilletia laevis]KAE8203438.1 hypothetical protein CF328_g1663 [Tilletia controversa]KAE8263586.1 hypothetical protein A4X03_0g1574 [Tilletia caries]KAE8207159.1 hypothetical protein CF335_g1349 [Tilletia laevis]KAE8253054.1 hypothetical protein A4X06_0g1737 [Tilletia controversa]
MQSKRWSSFALWLAILAAVATAGAAAGNQHLQPPTPASNAVARQAQATDPPRARMPEHRLRPERRKPAPAAPTPLSPELQRRMSYIHAARAPSHDRSNVHHPRLLFGPSPDESSSSVAAASSSEAAASSALASSAAIQSSISESIANASSTSAALAASTSAALASSSAAAGALASSSKAAQLSASKAAAAASASASASASAFNASIASSLAALSASYLANTVTSFTTTTPTVSAPAVPAEDDTNNDGHTSLIIGVSVVGGAALLGLLAFLYMKFGQKRDHYDDDDTDIKWPELRSEGDTAAMHPLPARRTGGAGFEMAGESDTGHDRDMAENDGGYGRDSFSGSTTALGVAAGGAAGYGAHYGTKAAGGPGGYHDVDGTGPPPGYGGGNGYYDQYGQPTAGGYTDGYADPHAAASPYGNIPPTTQGYYADGSSVLAGSDPHAAAQHAAMGQGQYGQDMYAGHQHAMASPQMQPARPGYGGAM